MDGGKHVTASQVAEYIIGVMQVDNLKLQKLLYYSQAVHLVRKGVVLFEDKIEAWRYGPVIPNVYHQYKHFGFDVIVPEHESSSSKLCIDQMKTIDMVLTYYGEMSAVRLVNETHSEDPWKDVYEENENKVIDVDVMREYYTRMFEFS